jgi:molecular chaperone HscB
VQLRHDRPVSSAKSLARLLRSLWAAAQTFGRSNLAGAKISAAQLEISSELNDGYRALRDPLRRIEHLLEIEGERKEGQTKQQAPPELLEEVFELNESLDELRDANESGGNLAELKIKLQSAETNFQDKLQDVDVQLQSAARDWDAAVDANADETGRKQIFARLNELLNRRSYIRNLVANVAKELEA